MVTLKFKLISGFDTMEIERVHSDSLGITITNDAENSSILLETRYEIKQLRDFLNIVLDEK